MRDSFSDLDEDFSIFEEERPFSTTRVDLSLHGRREIKRSSLEFLLFFFHSKRKVSASLLAFNEIETSILSLLLLFTISPHATLFGNVSITNG